jgi:hypothetical protein
VYLRKLSFEQELKDEPHIASIILLPTPGDSSDLGCVADEHPIAQPLHHLNESGTISASL